MRFRLIRCSEHPGRRGSLLCKECFERLRGKCRKSTMREISDRAEADVIAWPEWKKELWRRSQEQRGEE